ncbi:MAG TPA: large conductance mechanosensitive channel protein MscL [Thermoanaerobaculia bacterium]|nr:large conductance mechanosensitive channel protein MscL [Thermoanaerobaculia bacterium]
MLEDFKKFALRGNVVDMAVGFTVGVAFAAIARSLVDDLLMPPISLLTGRVDFVNRFWVLRDGTAGAPPYPTLDAAREAGAVTVNWGLFVNNLLTFLLIAMAIFLLVRAVNRLEERMEERFGQEKPVPGEPSDKKCSFCLSTIPYKAVRCPQCTSQLQPAGAGG